MKRLIIIVCLIQIIGHAQTEIATVLHKTYKAYMNEKVNLFINYDMQMERLWYIKMSGDDALFILVYIVLVLISYRYSMKLFLVSVLFLVYHLFDAFMFWYNFRTSYGIYWSMYAAVFLSSIILSWRGDRWLGKYKSMV